MHHRIFLQKKWLQILLLALCFLLCRSGSHLPQHIRTPALRKIPALHLHQGTVAIHTGLQLHQATLPHPFRPVRVCRVGAGGGGGWAQLVRTSGSSCAIVTSA
uniref:Secreted protein n=1 Tax=Setaria viridis TaxID=4556 RepID=A0A4U6V2Q9_SETVI|nr:hypothetical protein SEVIR_4G187901v2 [Setaria viridis]